MPYWEFNNISNILDAYLSGKTPMIADPPENVMKYISIRFEIMQELRKNGKIT